MPTPIENRFTELLAGGLNLGATIGPETETLDGGAAQVYEYGRIYFHQRLGRPYEVHGAILDRYLELGGDASKLGYPVSDEFDDPDEPTGRMSTFESGVIRWDSLNFIAVEINTGEPKWITRIIVKVQDLVAPPIPAGVDIGVYNILEALPPTPLTQQLNELLDGALARKAFFSLSEQDLEAMVSQAQTITPDYFPPNLNNFIEIDCPSAVDPDLAASLLGQLVGFVEYVYVAGTNGDATVVGTGNPLFGNQRYLKPAPEGVGAEVAWSKGADGAGVRVIDVELGWVFGHEDLPRPIHLLDGINVNSSRFHGLAVLGILAGNDDSRGIAGLCPQCTIDVISYAKPRGGQLVDELPERILQAARSVPFGSIVLIEAQKRDRGTNALLPVESQRLEFEAIRLATSLGVVVVEAAGNGNVDLDTFTDNDGNHTLNPILPLEFKQSNAVLVGASRGAYPHEKNAGSNSGSRIDCYAYGEHVATTGDPDHPDDPSIYWDPDREYRPGRFGFGGTSGASAIIAGVCALIQDLRLRLTPIGSSGRLGSSAMRALLGNRANGTDTFLATDRIGVMPDFAKILANEFLPS